VQDHLNPTAQAAAQYIGTTNQLGPTRSDAAQAGGQFFEDSLEFADDQLWGKPLPAGFRSRRGTTMTKYIPLMFIEGADHYGGPDKQPPPDGDTADANRSASAPPTTTETSRTLHRLTCAGGWMGQGPTLQYRSR